MLVTKLLLGRQIDQIAMVWRDRRGVGQKNLVNIDKALLFKHTPFIPISLQAPLSLQSFLAMPALACGKLLFKHSTFFLGCLHVAVLLFQSCFHFLFFLPFFPCLHPKSSACCHRFLPFQMSWLWFIYALDRSPSQHPLENG